MAPWTHFVVVMSVVSTILLFIDMVWPGAFSVSTLPLFWFATAHGYWLRGSYEKRTR